MYLRSDIERWIGGSLGCQADRDADRSGKREVVVLEVAGYPLFDGDKEKVESVECQEWVSSSKMSSAAVVRLMRSPKRSKLLTIAIFL